MFYSISVDVNQWTLSDAGIRNGKIWTVDRDREIQCPCGNGTVRRKETYSKFLKGGAGKQMYGFCSGRIPCTYLIDLTSLQKYGFHCLEGNDVHKVFIPHCPDLACSTKLDNLGAGLPVSAKKRKLDDMAHTTKDLKSKLTQYLADPEGQFFKYFTAKIYVLDPSTMDGFKLAFKCGICNHRYVLNEMNKNDKLLPKVIPRSIYDTYYVRNPADKDYNKTYRALLQADEVMDMTSVAGDTDDSGKEEGSDDDICEEEIPVLKEIPLVRKTKGKKIKKLN